MIFDEESLYDEDGFSDIEAMDAFMDVVKSHESKQKPSEIEAYLNDCKAFFRSVYNLGIEDGFLLAIESKEIINNINNNNSNNQK
jgi:hypothetical protein